MEYLSQELATPRTEGKRNQDDRNMPRNVFGSSQPSSSKFVDQGKEIKLSAADAERLSAADRCIYLSKLPQNFPQVLLKKFIRAHFLKFHLRTPGISGCLVRGLTGDALVAFGTSAEAKLALETLNGAKVGSRNSVVAHEWKPSYWNSFLRYFREEITPRRHLKKTLESKPSKKALKSKLGDIKKQKLQKDEKHDASMALTELLIEGINVAKSPKDNISLGASELPKKTVNTKPPSQDRMKIQFSIGKKLEESTPMDLDENGIESPESSIEVDFLVSQDKEMLSTYEVLQKKSIYPFSPIISKKDGLNDVKTLLPMGGEEYLKEKVAAFRFKNEVVKSKRLNKERQVTQYKRLIRSLKEELSEMSVEDAKSWMEEKTEKFHQSQMHLQRLQEENNRLQEIKELREHIDLMESNHALELGAALGFSRPPTSTVHELDVQVEEQKIMETNELQKEKHVRFGGRLEQLEAKIKSLEGHNKHLKGKLQECERYCATLKILSRHLREKKTKRRSAKRKKLMPCMMTLKQKLARNQRDCDRLEEKNKLLQHGIKPGERDLDHVKEELLTEMDQIETNHALEMADAQGSTA